MVSPLIATRAYAAAAKASVPEPVASIGGGGPGFGEMVQKAMGDLQSNSRHAEQAMSAQVTGKGQLVDVVTSVASAETSLETVIAVRDQVISAYQEMMRMAI